MALRKVVKKGDDVLRKKSKEVTEMTPKILSLLDDMAETMYAENGVGLAAPQVGILKRIVVIDIGEGLMELINPVILEESGEQIEAEGCLSIPNVCGTVKRPAKVVVEALSRDGKRHRYEGTDMLARAFCHEIDHLNGVLFEDKVIEFIDLESEK